MANAIFFLHPRRRSPPLQPKLPESAAQAEARARRMKETQEIGNLRKLLSATARTWPTIDPAKVWTRLGTVQATILLIHLNKLIASLTKLRDSAPQDLAEAFNEATNRT
jgi:hypothetical protein